jgi:hypothetical protein
MRPEKFETLAADALDGEADAGVRAEWTTATTACIARP